MLKQVWLNVIGNAIKYTPEGGTIEVKLDINPKNEQEVRVRITDNGIGMDKATTERILKNSIRATAHTQQAETVWVLLW